MQKNKQQILFLMIGLLVSTGCHSACHKLYRNVRRTIRDEPKCFDYCDSREWYEQLACRYWHKNFRTNEHTEDFRDGFVNGFSDYVYRGGNGDPPAVPPRRYWCPDTGTRRHQAAAEWFEGFQLGASTAAESGLRERVVIPVSAMRVSSDEDSFAQHGFAGVETLYPSQATFEAHSNAGAFYETHGQEAQTRNYQTQSLQAQPVEPHDFGGHSLHGHEIHGQVDYPLSEVTEFPSQPGAPPMSTDHVQLPAN